MALAALAVGLLLQAAGYPALPDFPDARHDRVARHLAEARRIAGDDLFEHMAHRCIIGSIHPARVVAVQSNGRVSPARLFDNLHSVGQNAVSAFALVGRNGDILLIDSLNNADEAEHILVPNLRAQGLDPARIRHVVVSQAHGDHYGGAAWLQRAYGAQVIASAADWDAMAAAQRSGNFAGRPIPDRDRIVADGARLDLGGTPVTFFVTPGHTAGALSLIFPVSDGGAAHVAGYFGGAGGARSIPELRAQITSVAHWAEASRAAGVDVHLAGHPLLGQLIERIELLRYRRPGDPHPFVMGRERYQRYVRVHGECARVQLARLGGD